MRTWVVGAGGMLGRALVRHARSRQAEVFDGTPIPWDDPAGAQDVLTTQARRFAEFAADRPWLVAWAAGASVVSTSTDATATELATFTAFLRAILEHAPTGPGACFVTSSAGGVYAGSSNPPFTAATPPRPVSPYGDLKLRQEEVARELLGDQISLVLGRFSNLYGPGHNTTKGQGLIPMLCRATVRRAPLNLYVPMDTVRDYLFVDDAAALAWQSATRAIGQSPPAVRVEVIASGQAATVADVIASVQTVAHRRVPLALGRDASSRHQARDLRLVPSVDVGSITATPLPAGIRRVFDATIGRPA